MDALDQQRYWEQTMATPRYLEEKRLVRFGAKAYSQNDEDGIIAEIFRRIHTTTRSFVEIGTGPGLENNTLALLVTGWRGLWIEAREADVASARARLEFYMRSGQLRIEPQFVSRDNVDRLLLTAGPCTDLDLLSIDVDGNDYYIWQAVQSIKPRVVIVEYNAAWFPPMSLTIPYVEQFQWQQTNYFGASLKALELSANQKGYRLVGCCFAGVNAFFVRDDLCNNSFCEPFTAENHYEPARYWMYRAAGHPPGVGPVERVG
jgi:hypothetical protein